MPGWMGLRGLVNKTVHDMERERRDDQKTSQSGSLERRSNEKVQEILRDQQGDMSAFTGAVDEKAISGNCADICGYPVEKIMSSKIAVLSFDDELLTVQGIFSAVKFRHLPVVDDSGNIIGIVSDRDFLRTASPFFGTVNEQNRDKELMARKVGTIMTRNPICARLETTVLEAIRLMNGKKISCLPVVHPETKKLFGIVTWKDVVRAFCPAGFNRASDSNRLKSGVKLNPETSESARIRAKSAESARLRQRRTHEEEANSASQRLAARIRASREEEEKGGRGPAHQPHPSKENTSDTRRISLAGITPELGQQDRLHGSTAGDAGSELAQRQRERMRREYHDRPDTAKSARFKRDELDDGEE